MEADFQSSILIVDDDMTDLNALHNILKSHYTIYFAKTGRTAIKRATENKPDIILLDVIMPDINGFEVLAQLKDSDITNEIPVIFITGLSGVSDEETGLRLGAVDYITKPFHSSIVKARVASHLKTAKLLRNKENASIVLKTRQQLRMIYLKDLLYVDVSGHWLNFHILSGETIEVYASLKDYEDTLLREPRFAKCHKSYIVNMDFVEVVEIRDVIMKNDDKIPISKGHLAFKKQYVEWIDGGLWIRR